MLASQGKAHGPAQQQQQVDPEQAAHGPEHIHRSLAVAQRGKGQTGTAQHSHRQQHQQGQSRALFPVQQRGTHAVTFSQPERTVFDPRCEVAPQLAGTAISLLIVQRAGVFFAQAYRFGKPAFVQVCQSSHAKVH